MEYSIIEKDNCIKLVGLKNFNLTHIFECGQAFRWELTEEDSYIVVANDRVIELLQKDDGSVIIKNTTAEDFKNIWHHFFDLDTDYDDIKKQLKNTKAYSQNTSLEEAMDFGYGIRILNQDQYEMIISFIISANNQIPRIKNSIRLLSENYGEFIQEYKGTKYYSFPKPEVLAIADPLDIREITRVGFRDVRIVEASRMYIEEPKKYVQILSDEALGNNLIQMPGIGPKVRDCILLFGYARDNTFPVDVWVKRLMEVLYIGETIPNSKILEYSNELFGELRGLAQQYLFYYARENKIGK